MRQFAAKLVELLMRPVVLVLLLLAGGCAAGSGDRSVTIGNQMTFTEIRRDVFPRVQEDGWNFTFTLEIDGCKDQQLGVDIFADNGGKMVPLGSATATPSFENTIWKTFFVFVPSSRTGELQPTGNFVVYVRSPDDPRTYLARSSFSYNWPAKDKSMAFEWLEYTEDAPCSSGGTEFSARVKLRVRGYKDQSMELVLFLKDAAGRPLTGPDGSPKRITAATLTPGFDHTIYESLTLRVPYATLNDLPPNQSVVVTPALIVNNTRYDGNVHLQCWAGGSLAAQTATFDRESQKFAEQIQHLQKQIDILEKEAGHE